ncbi:hypothetical protein L208DRAFT_1392539 [Tricholoma matsutake]|nr:hypothetical protein L208DRAFT_1392539 [Tricholoma matsutake 945]
MRLASLFSLIATEALFTILAFLAVQAAANPLPQSPGYTPGSPNGGSSSGSP